MEKKKTWHRSSGKTSRMLESAKLLRRPIALVMLHEENANNYLREFPTGSTVFSMRNIDLAYESGLPVFIDHSVFQDLVRDINIYPPPDQTLWRRVPAWPN